MFIFSGQNYGEKYRRRSTTVLQKKKLLKKFYTGNQVIRISQKRIEQMYDGLTQCIFLKCICFLTA